MFDSDGKRKFVILRKAAPTREDVTRGDVTREMARFEAAYPCVDHTKYSDGEVIAGRVRYAEPDIDKMFSAWLSSARHRLAHTARPDAGDDDVERVARAIYDATHAGLRNCYSWDDCWEDHQEAGRERYYKEARAALAAMREGVDRGMVEVPREPTEAMYMAGYDETRLADGTPQFSEAGFCIGHAGNIYRAMIEAAALEHPR